MLHHLSSTRSYGYDCPGPLPIEMGKKFAVLKICVESGDQEYNLIELCNQKF